MTGTPVNAETPSATASPICVSTASGRCGPCCSMAPTGMITALTFAVVSRASGHVRCSQRTGVPEPPSSGASAARSFPSGGVFIEGFRQAFGATGGGLPLAASLVGKQVQGGDGNDTRVGGDPDFRVGAVVA